MSMSAAQQTAFQTAAGFSPASSSTLWLSLVLVLALLWCAWVLGSAYRGWAGGSVRVAAFGGALVRVLLTLLVLMFFILS